MASSVMIPLLEARNRSSLCAHRTQPDDHALVGSPLKILAKRFAIGSKLHAEVPGIAWILLEILLQAVDDCGAIFQHFAAHGMALARDPQTRRASAAQIAPPVPIAQ